LLWPIRRWPGRDWLIASIVLVALPVGLPLLISPGQHLGELLVSLLVYVAPAGWGAAIARAAKRRLDREFKLLDHVERQAQGDLAILQNRDHPFVVTDQTYHRFLPADVGGESATPTTVRMVQSLCNEALGNRFPPISTTSQVYAIELSDGARRLRTPQTIALRLGILCTFVGLLLSLAAVGDIFRQGIDQSLLQEQAATRGGADGGAAAPPTATPQEMLKRIEPKISETVVGLTAAFGASIAGLMAAIVLQGFVEILQRQQRWMAKRIEDTVGILVNVLSLAQTGVGFARSLESLEKRLQQHQEDLAGHAHQVRTATEGATDALGRHASDARAAAATLAEQERTLADLTRGHAALLGQLRDSFAGMKEFEEKLTDALREQSRRLEAIGATVAQSTGEAMRGAFEPMRDALVAQAADARAATAGFDRAAERIAGAAEVLSEGTGKLAFDAALVGRLADTLDRVAAEIERRPRRRRDGLPLVFAKASGVALAVVVIGLGVAVAAGVVDMDRMLIHVWPIGAADRNSD
jgi:hypothetical protein